ncbi:ubiquitin carboxyl-terminal hydrolase 14 isoform X1 [Cryptomeria japonica]|uniref:ubiquitin carboxyl-terminal hydrolase 14 isoform X1 n=2 Tax=Cryptomeria japonica TaxID=3369 RepID=UPI0027D9E8E0|nr:ubiquitin carboxyl-terminal hydrolase 14 isoform X1 [Cryptomeria japonica]
MSGTHAMELLRSYLSRVRIPEASNRIYKEECCVSFDTPKSEGGLFVDLSSFLAFGKEAVYWNYRKTGNPVYLHIKTRKKPVSEDRPHKKPTLLAIGLEGGFENREPENEEFYNIVILPDFVMLPFPSVELPEKVRLSVDGVLAATGAERKEQVAAWTADKKLVSGYAVNLQQIDNGVVIPPSGWKCAKCDKVDNLWLNLTDGMILCGRRNWDGTGGNDHAVQHYNETKYPLAVKLGTITADLEAADVYSYPEDEAVEDPFLAQHLSFFGIDFSSLKKTELTTAERELDQNTNFDWNRIQESGKESEALFGPGYTGLINLGNSCYLASIMQTVFSTRDFVSRYFRDQNLSEAFERAPADPTVELNMQLVKLGHGMLSGKYSSPVQEDNDVEISEKMTSKTRQEGIPPRMFKTLIGTGHPEFSSTRQQDAMEFFLHLLDKVERNSAGNPQLDPSRCFKFFVEDRILCASGKVSYNRRVDNVLSLNIPLDAATNKEEVVAFQKKKAERELAGEKLKDEDIVRPRVPLSACLESFAAPEEIHGFYSTAMKSKITAIKTARFGTFPDYLVLHMRKFVMEAGWVPKKLDVFIDVPDTIDINHSRSKGLQPGEELLPENDDSQDSGQRGPSPDEAIVTQLASMGFPRLHCEKAAINTSNTGVEEAMNWLLSHMEDPDIDAPISAGLQNTPEPVNEESLKTLVSFGFDVDIARKALRASGGDIERATEWIFTQPAGTTEMDVSSSGAASSSEQALPDGEGKYRLMGFVSHIGTSTQCGHYVAHIFKEGRWVIFNDCKVAVSTDPPKDMGYLYFFERTN